jgi:hypothetical protein
VPDSALSPVPATSSDPLNRFGHAVLGTDHRSVSGIYVLVLLLFVIVRARTRRTPTLLEAIRVMLALVTISSGVVVSCVFLLTKPPAVEALSSDVLSLVGLLTIIITFGFGGRELVTSFFPSASPPDSTVESASPPP